MSCPFLGPSSSLSGGGSFSSSRFESLKSSFTSAPESPKSSPSPSPSLSSRSPSSRTAALAVAPGDGDDTAVTYWDYMHISSLTGLQRGWNHQGLQHDEEHVFIIVHQTIELWFKQIVHELEHVRALVKKALSEPTHPALLSSGTGRLQRAVRVLRLATQGYDIMETMNPADFLEFRDFLSPSSAFQSIQFREIEIMLGLKEADRVNFDGQSYHQVLERHGARNTEKIAERLNQDTLSTLIAQWANEEATRHAKQVDGFFKEYTEISRVQYQAAAADAQASAQSPRHEQTKPPVPAKPEAAKEGDATHKTRQCPFSGATASYESKPAAPAAPVPYSSSPGHLFFTCPLFGLGRQFILLCFTFPHDPRFRDCYQFLEHFLRFEHALLLWRQRHARMAELFIGRKAGTVGSSGVEYLDETASKYRVFQDLWNIRSRQIKAGKFSTPS